MKEIEAALIEVMGRTKEAVDILNVATTAFEETQNGILELETLEEFNASVLATTFLLLWFQDKAPEGGRLLFRECMNVLCRYNTHIKIKEGRI